MNIKLFFRQLGRSAFLSTVRFLSLFIGFVISIVIISWISKELNYDRFWENKDRLYRVAFDQYRNGELQLSMAPTYRGVTDVMLEELPEVEARVRFHRDMITVFTPDAQVQDVKMFYTDTSIFDVLKRKIIARESSVLFPDLTSVLISESLARKIFGDKNPIGRSLKVNSWELYVSAIFEDIPENSHLSFDLLLTIPTLRYYQANYNGTRNKLDRSKPFEYIPPGPYDKGSWGKWYGYSYILVREGTDIKELEKKAESLIRPENLPSWFSSSRIDLIFQPITGIHLNSNLTEEWKINGSIVQVYIMLLVALIVLIISMVNFINLSVMDFYDQYFNSAIRRIHGAKVSDLIITGFFKEFFISFLAGISSFIIGYYALKVFVPGSSPGFASVLMISALTIISALLTLIIPLWHLRTRTLQDMLKKRIISGSGGIISRKMLVTVQFAISIFLISGSIVIFYQLRYIQKKDPGFVPESVIFSYSPMTARQKAYDQGKLLVFRDRMATIAGVQGFCSSSSVPGKDFLFQSDNVARVSDEPDNQTYFQVLNVDSDYLETYGLYLVSGQNFTDTDKYPGEEIILNELAAKKIGFKSPDEATGEVIKVDEVNYVVQGVVKDFHHLSLKKELTPVIIFKSLKWRFNIGYYSFRISPGALQETIPLIGKAWEEIFPGERFIYRFLEDNYQEQYRAEQNFGRSITLGSFMAILISCLGLFGYARYSAAKRVKEIGVRKTFGASSNDILILFNKEILQMVAMAALFGLPLSWMLMNKWLQNFAYRIDASLWMFVTALCMTALIAVSATFYISWKSSMLQPYEALKYE